MIIGNLENYYTNYIRTQITKNYNIISFFDYLNYNTSQISNTLHNVLIFPIINSYDEAAYSSIGWECAIRSAFEGNYTVTSVFLISPDTQLIDDCVSTINSFDDSCIVDNIWLWPDASDTPKRNTDITKLPFQTKLS